MQFPAMRLWDALVRAYIWYVCKITYMTITILIHRIILIHHMCLMLLFNWIHCFCIAGDY